MKKTVWLDGGHSKLVNLEKALEIASTLLTVRSHLWEQREPGIDCEATWDDFLGDYSHPTLQDAVLAVFPDHADYGLTLVQAAVICMDKGLILSTGAIEEDYE